jgi:CBS domain-containing protein
MTTDPVACSPSDDLATVALQMWNWDCGALPVVDDGRLRGIVTDRDLCMALLFKGTSPTAVTIAEVVNGRPVHSCSPADDIAIALEVMRRHQVHRLPVVDDERLVGLLSLNDVILEAREGNGHDEGPTYHQVIETLQGVCSHHRQSLAAS